MSTIIINNIEITILRKRIKNINLRIDAEGVVKVSAPMRCPIKVIQDCLLDKQDWINQHVNRRRRPLTTNLIDTCEQHMFLGQLYPLMVQETTEQQTIQFEGNHICCFVKKNATSHEKEALLKKWQRTQLLALLPSLVKKWEPIIDVKVNEWGVKAMRTRWGSCNPSQKRIWISLYLIEKPLICLEYVLVHEMVHLLEASHNKRFQAYMTQFMPEWRIHKNSLNEW